MFKKIMGGICCLCGGCLVGFCSRELNQTMGIFGLILGIVMLAIAVTIFTRISE